MIDLSSLKSPGWQRVIAELHAPAPDDRTFLVRLVAVLAQVSGARQAVLFAIDRAEDDAAASLAEPRTVLVWPQVGEETPELEAATDIKSAARETAAGVAVRVFGLDKADSGFYGDDSGKGYVVAVPVQQAQSETGPGPRAVVTLLVESRSRQALQTTLAMIEVLAGYTQLHAVRQQLRRTRAAGAALDLAARLIASINNSPNFRGAALQLVNDLSRQVRADRVALGWVHGVASSGAVRAVAVSDTEQIDRRMAMIQKLEAAMDECLDQEHAVMFPPPPPAGSGGDGDVVLSQSITHAHRELCATDARLKVVSLPLRQDDRVVGVVTVESTAEGPGDVASVELLQASLDLIAPVMVLRRSDDQPLPKRAWTSTLKSGAWIVGPRHTAWKLAAIGLLCLLVFVTFFTMPYRVDAQAELQPRLRNNISVPFDGIIQSLGEGVEPGKTVHKGDLLLSMNTDELKLQLLHARSEIIQYEKEADTYLQSARDDRRHLAEAQQAQARAAQAQAKADLAQLNIDHSRIVSPIDGVIIAGDLTDKIGAAVKLGDPLFQIAPAGDIVVIARVSDRDIALIHDPNSDPTAPPTRGEVATKSNPGQGFPFIVDRVVPLAQSKDGKNTFEIRGKLDGNAPWLRPGMEGVAKLDTGRHSLLWIGTRRIRDQLRLWLWW